jgi:hypothetical protein
LPIRDPEDPVEALRERLRAGLGVPTLYSAFRVYWASPPAYGLRLLSGRTVVLGAAPDILDPRKVEQALLIQASAVMPYYTAHTWRDVARRILELVKVDEDMATCPDPEEEDMLALADYAESRPEAEMDYWDTVRYIPE